MVAVIRLLSGFNPRAREGATWGDNMNDLKQMKVKVEVPIFYDDSGYYLDEHYNDFPADIAEMCEEDILKQIENKQETTI